MDEGLCVNPVWPCAMTGACSVLAGFSGLNVLIHGSSGCYYYPRSLLKVPLFSTYLLESEIVFGTVERLKEVVNTLSTSKRPIAVLNTCIPALTGEDLSGAFSEEETIFVDAPGFIGSVEDGAKIAFERLGIETDASREGVNIDGVSLLDLFWRGNLHEAKRILTEMGIPTALCLAKDSYENLRKGAALHTVSVNPSYPSGVGTMLGSFLFPDLKDTCAKLADIFPNADIDPLLEEWNLADEQLFYSSDKYLRKYEPPVVAVCAQESYALFAKSMMERYFGADVPVMLARNHDAVSIPSETDLTKIAGHIAGCRPDLILGSTFEANGYPNAAFLGITPPDRSRVSIAARPIAGIEGGIMFLENVLNTLIDATSSKQKK
ncbi:oxidoreductase/nitrogenase, component 1 [Methanocorpusculum labreanum Z]|uniref:Oxidoreductase/nitrogenase, component 1 n=1 Tax=Methanocorpusculum labreanum (strain ATCC 43576 / DSM 4855 / Z) TaxID=410358 RepID=A2SPT3_METLZ|nr:nitrogenase component 1 [Methanocorpusculum labreanum]ABN06339.1 oxidoreductase/nitrogenase, component 1 [Methanocorpusculum labreanum Z]